MKLRPHTLAVDRIDLVVMGDIVEVKQGKLRGKLSVDYNGKIFYSFHGIPYAKPPLGELRFKAPVPPETWEGVRNATVEASPCIAVHAMFLNKNVGSEDCLYLNVYTSNTRLLNTNDDLKPVMFWIHGGGFKTGSSETEIYGPEILMTTDVVLVTVNYRLGIFGFFKLEDPKLGVPGNAGMKDIVMALKWVQENIAKFGGDPANVTVFGESAGAAAVHGLMLSPMAKGLFHRGILQSGSIFNTWVFGQERAAKIAKLLDYKSENEEDILKFLRSVPTEKLFEAQNKIPEDYCWDHKRSFGLSIEDTPYEPMFLSKSPLDIIESGEYNKVPIIIGFNSNEGLFLEAVHTGDIGKFQICTDFERAVPYYLNVPKGSDLSQTLAKKIQEGYYGSATPSNNNPQPFFDMWSDMLFIHGIYKAMEEHLSNMECPIYFYLLTADTRVNFFKHFYKCKRPGACHMDDVGYLFANSYLPRFEKGSVEELVTKRILTFWTNFAKTGDPNPVEKNPLMLQAHWKPVKKDRYHCLEIGSELKCISDPFLERLNIWDDISFLAANTTHL